MASKVRNRTKKQREAITMKELRASLDLSQAKFGRLFGHDDRWTRRAESDTDPMKESNSTKCLKQAIIILSSKGLLKEYQAAIEAALAE